MAIQTLPVPKGAVLSINNELSIPVGTEVDIVNESILYNVYLKDSLTQPSADTEDKRSLTQRDWSESTAWIEAGTLEVWVYSPRGEVIISVQEL